MGLDCLKKPLNKYIDHTLLKPDATQREFQQFLDEVIKYDFASACVSPYMALPLKEALKKDHPNVKVCTVVGFPHGNIPAPLKVQEVHYFASQGIDEIDFVINIGLLKSELYQNVGDEMMAIDQVCRENDTVSKCIIETCYLTDDEKAFMYKAVAERTEIDYIKTSTGFGTEGAALRDVMDWNARRKIDEARREGDLLVLHEELDRKRLVKIKAAGGIRDLQTALRFITCGADRLGMSASVKVMEEYNELSAAFTEGEETTE